MNLKDAIDFEYPENEMAKPLKNITLSEADSTETFKFKPFEYERGAVTKTTKGVINTIRDMQDLPEQVKIFGKRLSFGFGGYFGDTEEETERKKLNLITAERNLNEAQAERYKYTSGREAESLSYGVGGGIVNYGTMLIPAGLVGGGLKAVGATAKAVSAGAEAAGLGTMGVMELAGQVQDKTPMKDGEIDVEAMTPEWARKATGGTIAYAGVSALTEKYVGFGRQMKMWSKPIQWGGSVTSKALTTLRTAGANALSEGATEGIQDLEAAGIGLIDGTLTMDKLPARLQQAWKSAIIGGIIGGGVGTAAAMKSARNVKKQLREMVAPVVGEQDANTVAEAIYNAGTDDMTKAISIELELSSELKNKHGKVWNSMLAAVSREIEGKPRFMAMSEDERASYANTVAKHFADQVLAEANYRGTTIDAIFSASDITYDKGIRLERHINLFDALKNPEMIPPETKLKRESLLAFLKRKGGLKDYGGELKARDAQKLYPGLVSNKGMNFDDAALMAWQYGYFPSKMDRPDINEFLEAVDESLRGNHRYNVEEERTFTDALDDLEQELDRMDIDWRNMTAAEIEKAVDELPELQSLEREAAFYEQFEPEIGLSEDEAERFAIETEGKEYPIIDEKDLPERYYQEGDNDIEKLQQELKDWQEQLEKDKENPYNLNEKAVENNIKFDKKEIARIKKQIKELEKSSVEPLSEKLYATHNMSLAGVRDALKLGGLAMPSLAMRKVSQGDINQFGDIVFVANERLATPSRTNEVYDRDAWTPNLSSAIKYELSPEANTFIKQVLEKVGQPLRASTFRYNIEENLGFPQSDTMAQELYELDKGLDDSKFRGNEQEYLDWYNEHFMANTEPYLWTENASNTDMVRKKFTLDNMMKILRKQEKSGGGFIGDFIFDVYKLLNFRSQKFKNLKEIKKNRHKLVSREEAQKGLDKLNEDFLALAEELKKEGEDYSFGDATYGLGVALVQDTDKEIVRWLDYKNLKSDEQAIKKVKDFIERMKDIPTDYFEVKPRRVVDFSEFSGVIIPEGAQYDEVANILKKQHFLNVERVEKGNEAQYEQALNNIQANASTTFFQLSSQEEENFTEMYVSEGKKGVLDWINRQVEYYRNAVDDAVNENARAYMRQLRDKKIAWLREVEDFINNLDKKDDTFYRSVANVNDLNVGDFIAGMGEVTDKTENQVKIKDNWYANSIIERMIEQGQINLTNKPKEKERLTDKGIEKKAKKYFGTTTNLAEAGYILSDGSMLDFSGKKEGGTAGTRAYDHRQINEAFEDSDIGMEEFVNNGAIRYMPESNSLYIANVPTPEQIKVISQIVNRANGEVNLELVQDAKNMGVSSRRFFKEFDSGSTIKNIKNAINAYYSGNLSQIQEFFQRGKNAKGVTQITPDAYIIKLLEGADESTLPHEFAHYWITEMWNYVRSGRASENYMKRWNVISDYLGIKPEQTRLTRGQQEKFASSYEAYLTRGELPTPLIGSAFDDYDKWLQRVYSNYNRINYQSGFGKRRVRLTDAAIKFFQSMTTGTLEAPALAPKDTGVEVPQTVSAEEVIEPTNEIIETPTTYDTTRVINITEGEKGVSKVFQREAMKHADRIVDELGVSYNKINLEEQAIKAAEWVQNNLDEAREVVNGKAAPEGIIDTAIFIAYENEMLRIGNNAEYQRALKIHSQVQTQRGQAIAAERISTDDVYNPAYWWKKLQKNKETDVARKLFKGDTEALNKMIETETKSIMKQIAGKPKEEQVEALTKLAEKLQKDYKLDTLYQMPDDVNERTVREFIKDTIGVNPDVMAGNEVINKAEQLQKLWENTKDSSGNPSVEAMRAKRELNDLIQAQTPSNALAIWTSIFGRGIMLTSVKSPVLNIISNIEAGFTEGITRRLMYGATEKAVDKTVKEEFSKYAWEVYKASADIVTTMNDYDDDMRIIGEQILHSQGPGAFRAASRKVEEVSFKYLMGAPDAVAKTLAFNDTADLLATKIAKEEGAKDISKRATEIYKDAILIKPETEVGQKVREQAQAQAHYTTFTNDSWAARFGLSARNWLNMVGRNKIRLGDLTMKFVKTPANVQMMGLEYGFGSLYTLYNVQEIIKNPQSETSQIAIRAAVRNGLGIALAALLYSMLDPDDYFSEFDTLNPKEKDRMRAMGAMPNSIKIGNRWVSLDYFGQLGIPLVGMLEARRNNGLRSYIQSGLTQAAKIPGIKETKQLIDNMSEYARYDLKPEKIAQMMAGTVLDQARAMTIPAIVNDIAKMTDDYERDTMGGVMDKVISSIPGLRQTLPERYGIQGLVRTEPALSTLLFGSRVKTEQSDKLVREVEKLAGKAEQPSISDVTKYGDLRLLSPEKKVKVRKEFYKAYNAESKKLISTREYQKKSPEDKKKALNKVRSRVVKSLKEKYSNDIQREKRRR